MKTKRKIFKSVLMAFIIMMCAGVCYAQYYQLVTKWTFGKNDTDPTNYAVNWGTNWSSNVLLQPVIIENYDSPSNKYKVEHDVLVGTVNVAQGNLSQIQNPVSDVYLLDANQVGIGGVPDIIWAHREQGTLKVVDLRMMDDLNKDGFKEVMVRYVKKSSSPLNLYGDEYITILSGRDGTRIYDPNFTQFWKADLNGALIHDLGRDKTLMGKDRTQSGFEDIVTIDKDGNVSLHENQ